MFIVIAPSYPCDGTVLSMDYNTPNGDALFQTTLVGETTNIKSLLHGSNTNYSTSTEKLQLMFSLVDSQDDSQDFSMVGYSFVVTGVNNITVIIDRSYGDPMELTTVSYFFLFLNVMSRDLCITTHYHVTLSFYCFYHTLSCYMVILLLN